MPIAGPQAGSATDNAGVGNLAWVNPTNSQVDDGSFATADASFSLDDVTHYLKMTFGFTIPGGATIDGVLLSVKRKTSLDGLPLDYIVRLVLAGTVSGDNKSAGAAWSSTEGTVSFGGASDTWGLGLTPTDVNDTGFGFVIAATDASSGGWIAQVNYMELSVYYTEAGVSGVQTMALMGVGG